MAAPERVGPQCAPVLQSAESTQSADGSLAERGFEARRHGDGEQDLTPSGLLMEDTKDAKKKCAPGMLRIPVALAPGTESTLTTFRAMSVFSFRKRREGSDSSLRALVFANFATSRFERERFRDLAVKNTAPTRDG